MRLLLTGAAGQVGREVALLKPGTAELVPLTRRELDVTVAEDVAAAVRDASPDVIVNAAAYTAVDRAESEEELAFAVNAIGASHLAEEARAVSARLIQLSTDFVFDGSRPRPWRPEDEPRPLSAYGRTKLAGEKAVRSIAGDSAVILRTSWVYSQRGNSFVATMLDLMKEKQQLSVVYDQFGSPTWARNLARAIWRLAAQPNAGGILHWSDDGVASKYDFAAAIQQSALDLGLLEREIPIVPVPTAEYPTAAVRPAFSVLDTLAARAYLGTPQRWLRALWEMLSELASSRETTDV